MWINVYLDLNKTDPEAQKLVMKELFDRFPGRIGRVENNVFIPYTQDDLVVAKSRFLILCCSPEKAMEEAKTVAVDIFPTPASLC